MNCQYLQPGRYWFEYHCCESHDSSDAELWYRSQSRVDVLSLEEYGGGRTRRERLDNGHPACYKVRFMDGYRKLVFEDEILNSRKEFSRDRPPARPDAVLA